MTAIATNDNLGLAKTWAIIAGAVLVLVGILGFIPNPLVGSADGALVPTDALHNIVHLGTGLLALYIGFGLRGMALANGVIGFGVLYVVIFLAVLVSPTLFGLFSVAANIVLHIIHAALAVVSLALGYMARGSIGAVSDVAR
ncbi:MAG: DUF4383 domain-containing protein [Candidatus Limnocylindria bacterium]